MKNSFNYSDTKQEKINSVLNSDFTINEIVSYPLPRHGTSIGYIREIKDDKAKIENYYGHTSENNVCDLSQLSKYIEMIGFNPFENQVQMDPINFALESIIQKLFKEDRYTTRLGSLIPSTNFDPIVFDENGEVVHYQRGHVWKLENKQALIESLYNGVDCGKIIVRERDWSEIDDLESKGEKYAFYDVVDGKQRLTAINEFIENVYPDASGNYFNDLSNHAQYKFMKSQLISYTQMKPNSKDSDVIKTFLRMNFSGIPQSQEHLDYLKSIKL